MASEGSAHTVDCLHRIAGIVSFPANAPPQQPDPAMCILPGGLGQRSILQSGISNLEFA